MMFIHLFILLKDQAPAAIQEKLQQLENENKTLTSSLNKLQQAQQQAHASQSHTDNQNKSLLKQIEDLQACLILYNHYYYHC